MGLSIGYTVFSSPKLGFGSLTQNQVSGECDSLEKHIVAHHGRSVRRSVCHTLSFIGVRKPPFSHRCFRFSLLNESDFRIEQIS